jgi:PKD repeat protein
VNKSYATGNVTGDHNIGGFAGCIDTFHIGAGGVNNSYATGNVTGNHDVGGLLGHGNHGVLSNSYSAGNVTGIGNNTGGLVGFAQNSTVSGCFWDNGTSGQKTSAGGIGRTTAQMKTRSTFINAGWDFNNTWFMIENITYPVFQWQDILHPIANAGIDQTVDEGTIVTFNGRGSFAYFGIANYTWTFRDVDSKTLYGVGPTYKFNDLGIFVVTLNVTDSRGNWGIDTMTVTVKDITAPMVDAGPDQTVYEGALVSFDGSASKDNAGIFNYRWSFMDEGPQALDGVQPTYQFDDPGIFVVTLKVTDLAGNWGTDNMTVTVMENTPPVANAGPDQKVDEGTLVTFNGSKSSDNIGIVNYTWTFTDGARMILHGVRQLYQFDNPGFFVVTLNVTDAAGNWATDTMTVTVIAAVPVDDAAPVADAGPDQTVNERTQVSFDGSGSSDNVGIADYSWTFMDGIPITLAGIQPTFYYNISGTFVVMLNVTDAAGNWGTDTMTVSVIDVTVPFSSAGPDQIVDEGTLVAFDGSGSIDNVGVENYTWTFMDGALVSLYGDLPTYRFDNPGIFVVTLNVTDADGNWGTDTITVTVKDLTAPVADAGPDRTVDEGTVVTFNGNGSFDNAGIINYTWTFDCGTQRIVLYGVSPSFTFSIPGVYNITVNVSDAAGFRQEDNMTLTVKDVTPPVANAGRDKMVRAGSVLVFDGSRSTDNVGVSKYFWNFSYDGKTRSIRGEHPTFEFDRAGTYEVVLTVIDAAGNRGDDNVVIEVEPTVNVDLGSLAGLLWLPVLLILVAGIAGYMIMRRRKARKDGPSQSQEDPAK